MRAKQTVQVREHLEGSISAWFKEQRLPIVEIEKSVIAKKVYKKRGYDPIQRRFAARQNKHKTPWSQFQWLTKNRPSVEVSDRVKTC